MAHKSDAQMQCRHPGCTSRSRGPRFGYRCAAHAIPGKGDRHPPVTEPAPAPTPEQ